MKNSKGTKKKATKSQPSVFDRGVEPGDAESAESANYLKAIADPTRLRIVRHLIEGPAPVNSIVEALEVDQPSISHHLAILKHAGIVEVRAQGRFRIYRLHPDIVHSAEKGTVLLNFGTCRVEVDAP